MDTITQATVNSLISVESEPSVSLYMPVCRTDHRQDVILLKDLLKEAAAGLMAQGQTKEEAREFLRSMEKILEDKEGWKPKGDGIAMFLSKDFFRMFQLPCSFKAKVNVGGPVYILPLIPLLHRDENFLLLSLSQNAVKLWRCDPFEYHEVETDGVPKNFETAMLTHDRDEPLTYHTRRTSSGSWCAIFEGHGVGIDDHKEDLQRYCRQVDHGIHAAIRNEKCPLVLAAVEFMHPLYREVNSYRHLLADGIHGNPDRIGIHELHKQAWKLVKPNFEKTQKEAVSKYEQWIGTKHATCGTRTIVPAAVAGIVDTLFVTRDVERWGRFDPMTGDVEDRANREPGDQELMNLAAVHAIKHASRVYVLEPEKMPTDTTVAGTLRRPLA